MNKEMLAVDQDPAGIQAKRVKKNGGLEIWVKQLADGSRAVGLLNRTGSESEIGVHWTDLGYPENLSASVRDLWAHRDKGVHKGGYAPKVPSHGTVVIRVVPQ
jgi:alpha-galactosidase